ncbi:hypothetical protein KSP40_PGU000161 [Platanthera guangdongensis]|uniref:Uncharacterized protein n=1 Tax=Platanthera guangdongensis TaxID=2320717 RepID=A0ABR2LJJ9_9ASPA
MSPLLHEYRPLQPQISLTDDLLREQSQVNYADLSFSVNHPAWAFTSIKLVAGAQGELTHEIAVMRGQVEVRVYGCVLAGIHQLWFVINKCMSHDCDCYSFTCIPIDPSKTFSNDDVPPFVHDDVVDDGVDEFFGELHGDVGDLASQLKAVNGKTRVKCQRQGSV